MLLHRFFRLELIVSAINAIIGLLYGISVSIVGIGTYFGFVEYVKYFTVILFFTSAALLILNLYLLYRNIRKKERKRGAALGCIGHLIFFSVGSFAGVISILLCFLSSLFVLLDSRFITVNI